MRSHVQKDDQSLRGQSQLCDDFPRDYPLAVTASLGAAYEEGFPVISRFGCRNRFRQRAIQLPDKEFRYLRTVIVTAAVYRGLDSKLRPKANLSS